MSKNKDTFEAGTVSSEIKRLAYLHPDVPVYVVDEDDETVYCVQNIIVGEHKQIVIRVKAQNTIMNKERAFFLKECRDLLPHYHIPSLLFHKYELAFHEGKSAKQAVREIGGKMTP